MVLDDYKAAHVKPSQVTFLLQNYGGGMARGRLDAHAETRNAFPIRATLISSGEDQPEGEASALARILSIPLARGDVDRAKLTLVQEQAAYLPVVLVHYLRWLATQPPCSCASASAPKASVAVAGDARALTSDGYSRKLWSVNMGIAFPWSNVAVGLMVTSYSA